MKANRNMLAQLMGLRAHGVRLQNLVIDAECRLVELLLPPKSGRRNDLSTTVDRFVLPPDQVYKLRKVYGGLPADQLVRPSSSRPAPTACSRGSRRRARRLPAIAPADSGRSADAGRCNGRTPRSPPRRRSRRRAGVDGVVEPSGTPSAMLPVNSRPQVA